MAIAVEPAHPPTTAAPGLSVGMMGMYIFLCSEVMFFGSMFAAYYYIFGSHPEGWPPAKTHPVEWFPTPLVNTFVLFTSGVTGHFALDSLTHGGRSRHKYGAAMLVVGIVCMLASGLAAFLAGERGYFAAGLGLAGAVVTAMNLLPMLGMGPFLTGRQAFIGLLVGTIVLGAGFEIGQLYEFANAQIKFQGLNQFSSTFFTMTGFHGVHVFGGLILLTLVLGRTLKGNFSANNHLFVAAATLYWHFVDVVWIFLFLILYLAVTAVPGSN